MTKNRDHGNHSAVLPDALLEWFIELFTQEGDTVQDPSMDSGTTIRVAKRMGRNGIGIELLPQYYELTRSEIIKEPERLL